MYKLKFQAREWQKKALSMWENNSYRGIVRVATGGGKTIFSELCILKFLAIKSNGKVLIIVPTIALAEQWAVNLEEELSVQPAEINIIRGLKKLILKRFNIVVINTARKLKIAEDLSNWFLIVDECHRSGSPINSKALEGNYFATLGLSATPEREFDEGFIDFIQPSLGNIIFEYDLQSARKDKILSDFEVMNVKTDFFPNEKKEYFLLTKRIIQRSRNFGDEDQVLKVLLMKRARISSSAIMRIVIAVKLVEQNRDKRIIVFHEGTKEASIIAKKLKDLGHSVGVYHSKIGVNTRLSNLRLFKKGINNVLVCCKALDEGLNVPDAAVAIIASSSSSIRQRVQRLGRILRPHPSKKLAQIYTIYITDNEELRLKEEEANLLEVAKFKWIKVTHG